MRNKKFLSALLVAILLCSCIAGVLMVRANAAGATWYVTDTADTANNKYGTVQAALDAAKGKTWAAGDTLTIEIQTKTAQKMDETGDILFGIPTIFRADHSRLPITIQGKSGVAASLNVGNLSGSVNCSNSYTFKNLKSDLAIKNLKFYAGSGEVVFDNVDFGVSASNQASTILASDLSTAEAFSAWKAANISKAKADEKAKSGDELIKTSLTLKGITYDDPDPKKSSMGVTGSGLIGRVKIFVIYNTANVTGNVNAKDLKVETILDNTRTYTVFVRNVGSVSQMGKEVLTLTGGSNTARVIGTRQSKIKDNLSGGVNKYKDFTSNMVINVDNATIRESNITGLEYAQRNVNLTVNIIKGSVPTISLAGSGSAAANITLNITPEKDSDVTISGTVNGAVGSSSATNGACDAEVSGTIAFNITGGTFGGEVKTCGTATDGHSAVVGNIQTSISGGQFAKDFIQVCSLAKVTNFTSTISGGNFAGFVGIQDDAKITNAPSVKVSGNITVSDNTHIEATEVVGNLTLSQSGTGWANGQAYLSCKKATNYTVTAADKGGTKAIKINTPDSPKGYAFQLLGGGMDLYAYFTIDDDINLFAAFPVDFVNNNMVNGKFAYDFRYQGKSTALASGNLTTSSEKKDGYYIVDLGPVDASNAKAPIICNGTLHYRITNALEIVARAGKNVDGSLNASEQVLFNALEDLFYEIEHIKNNPNGHYNYSENKVIEGVRKEVVAGLALHTIPSLKTIFSKGGTAIKSIGVVASNKGSLGFEIVVTSSAEPKLNFTWKGASAATTFNSDRCIIKNSGSGTYTIQIFLNVDELIKDFTLEIKNGNTVIETVNASLEKIAEIVINVNTGGDTEFDNDEENDSYTDNPTYKEVFPAVVLQMIQAIKHYEGVTTLPQMPNIKEELNAIPTIDNDARIQALIKKGSSRTAAENAELEAALRDIVVRYMKLQLTFPYTPVFAEGETKIYDYNTMNGNEPLSYVEERLYGGVPYMQATTGNAYRLLRFYNYENGVGTLNFVPIINTSRLNRERNGSYYFNAGSDIFGNSCASSTFWALSRVTNEIKGCWCATMVPATGNGFLPVGTYTYATGDNPGQILKKNTKATIFAAYEKLKPGDNLLSNGHAMMALSAPYTNSEGKRAVLVGEQIAIRTTTSGVGKEAATGDYGLYTQYDFNYRHQGKISEYTFETLSAKYIPIRVPEFEPTHAKYLAVEATQVTCSNSAANSGSATKISVSDFLNLSFSSNYVISDLTLKVTKNGKTETYFAMTGNPYKNDMSVHKKVKFNHTTNDSADYTAGKLDNIFAVLTYFNEAGDVIYVTQLSDLFAGASSITVDCQVSSGTVKTFNFTITG